jgi:hypothetical protein
LKPYKLEGKEKKDKKKKKIRPRSASLDNKDHKT